MATLDINIQSQNQARRDLLNVRQQIQDVNVALTRNRQATLAATREQRVKLREDRQELLLGRQKLSNSAAQIRLRQAQTRETERLTRAQSNLNIQTGRSTTSFGNFAASFRFLGTATVVAGIAGISREIAQIGIETETARATLRQFTNDTEALFNRLEGVSRRLIGFDLPNIIQSFTAFSAAGAGEDDAITIIEGFSRSLSELGRSAQDTGRFFTQLTQSYAANRIEGDDVKTLIEVLPNFMAIASRAIGTNVESWKDLQEAIEANGLTVREFYTAVGSQQQLESAGADLNTFRAQWELLREELQGVARDIAQDTLPALTRLIRLTREGVFGADPPEAVTNIDTAAAGTIDSVRRLDREFQVFNITTGQLETVTGEYASRLFNTSQDLQNLQTLLATNEQRQNELNRALINAVGPTDNIRNEIQNLTQEHVALSNAIRAARDELINLGRAQAEAARAPSAAAIAEDRRLFSLGQFGVPRLSAVPGQQLESDFERQLERIDRNFRDIQQAPPATGISDVPGFQTELSFERALQAIDSEFQRRIENTTEAVTGISDVPGFQTEEAFQRGLQAIDREYARRLEEIQPFDVVPDTPGFLSPQAFDEALANLQPVTFPDPLEQTLIEASRRASAAILERQVLDEERIRGSLRDVAANALATSAEVPVLGFNIRREGAQQRLQVAQRASQELQRVETDLQNRIDEINQNRLLSEQERANAIIEITQRANERKLALEESYNQRIQQIEDQTTQDRIGFSINLADGVIQQINRIIAQELALRFVRQIGSSVGALPLVGILGAGVAITSGIAAIRNSRTQSLAREQQNRFETGVREGPPINVSVRNDDGSVRRQRRNEQRVIGEGRTGR